METVTATRIEPATRFCRIKLKPRLPYSDCPPRLAQPALAPKNISARPDNDGDPDPFQQIREIAEHQISEERRADDLDVLHRCDEGGRRKLSALHEEKMPRGSENPH